MNFRDAGDDVKEEFELLNLDTIKEIGDLDDVTGYYYTMTTYLNSDDIEKVSYEDLFTKPSQRENEANKPPMNMPQDGGRKEIKMTNGDYTVIAYSNISYNEDFINGNKKIIKGEMISKDSEAKEIIISEELATDNEIEVGDKITFTNAYDEEVTYKLKVVGIYETTNDETEIGFNPMKGNSANQIITNIKTVETIKESDDDSDFSLSSSINAVFYIENEDLETFTEGVRYLGVSDYYEIRTNEEEILETLTPIQNIASFSLTFLFVVLIVGAIILTIINLFNIRERKYEIGVLRAIGMTKGKVTLQLVTEVFIVALISLIIGTGVGAVLTKPVSTQMLKSEIESMNKQEENIKNNFGGRGFERPNMPKDMRKKDIDYVDTLDVNIDILTIIELFGVSLLLTIVSGTIAVMYVNKYEPNRILQNRN